MNIEEAIKVVRNIKTLRCKECVFDNDTKCIKENGKDCQEIAIETLLTAYEKEKEKNKELENDLKDIIKKYMEAESVKFWYNYIHKDKIRKMLKELEDRRNKQPVIGYWSKKAMLEKLLKEE